MKAMKDISLRPKKQLLDLFEAVMQLENLPSTNRNALVDRALDVALKNETINWKAVSEVPVEVSFHKAVPAHIVLKVDEEKFSQVNDQIKRTFQVEKITIPYTLKLLLTLYFIHLKQQGETASRDETFKELLTKESGMKSWFLKNEYEQSIYSGKKRLLEICRVFLKENPVINKQLLTQSEKDFKESQDWLDIDKYFNQLPQMAPTKNYLAKVLAGLFIFRVESFFENGESKTMLDNIVMRLENECQIIGAALTKSESTDYYKHVYAKMMGGKI